MFENSNDGAWQISILWEKIFFDSICYKILVLHLLKADMHEENSTSDILNFSNE